MNSMSARIPLFKIYWDEADIKSVTKSLKTGMNWSIGQNIGSFEQKIGRYVGTEYATVFNSGTSALHSALLAYGVGTADEVIVPSFTFVATANAPLFVGAKPVFADIEDETFGLDPEDVNERITKHTKAIIPVHYGGCPCKITELTQIAQDHDLVLIEDAAESFGAKIEESRVGAFGDSAMFSFCQNKIITTGDGGAITTDSKQLRDRLELIRSHGQFETLHGLEQEKSSDYIALGYNFRMSNIIAALGIAQLDKVDAIIDMRRRNANYLTSKLKREGQDVVTPVPPRGYYHVYQMYTIRHPARDQLMSHLFNQGIMTKVYFPPVHQSYFYREVLNCSSRLPVTEELAGQVLTLPLWPHMKEAEMNYVVDAICSLSR
jgi:perosamine synthetase